MTTQGAIFNYEEVIDLHTEANRVSVIGIHTPTGDTPRKLCPGFFQQFKKYKYLGCSISLVPAATLPADPLQVGAVESGAPTIDPRDMLNPIMFHGCHGNDLGNILNRLYSSGLADTSDLTQIMHSDSIDFMSMMNYEEDPTTPYLNIMESLYYRALTDNTWKKAHIQRGFRKSGLKPRIYSLATNMQLMGQTTLGTQRAPGIIEGTIDISSPLNPNYDIEDPVVNPVRYFTPRTVPLGWLDTRQVVPYVAEGEINDVALSDVQSTIEDLIKGKTVWNELPEIYMGIIMLPPAYLQEQYFRLIINHAFAFKGFRGISMSNDMLEMPPNYENWNDDISVPPVPDPPVGASLHLTGWVASGAPNVTATGFTQAFDNYATCDYAPSGTTFSLSGITANFATDATATASTDIKRLIVVNNATSGVQKVGVWFETSSYQYVVFDGKVYAKGSWSTWDVYDLRSLELTWTGGDAPTEAPYIGTTTGIDVTPESGARWTKIQAQSGSLTELLGASQSAHADLVPIPRLRPRYPSQT